MKSPHIKVIIVGNFRYPYPNAPSNRIHAYAKALRMAGVDCVVLSYGSYPGRIEEGMHEGVPFYCTGSQRTDEGAAAKALAYLPALWRALLRLRSLLDPGNSVVFAYRSKLVDDWLLFGQCRLNRSAFVKESCEAPDYYLEPSRFRWLEKLWYERVQLKLPDGMICISRWLEDFAKAHLRRRSHIVRIPILVDLSRFSESSPERSGPPYVGYIGDMNGDKDGVDDLLRAFAIVREQIGTHELHVVGYAFPERLAQLRQLAVDLRIDEWVRFRGVMTLDQVPPYLQAADALLLARPDNLQAKAGLPTKLAEYLATGNPVVVTRVGDIPLYLEDGVNAYLCAPNDPDDFAAAMIRALQNRELALQIGACGREVARDKFDYSQVSEILKNYMNTLVAYTIPQA